MKRYKAASILMLIHGGFMEIGGCLCLIPILLSGSDAFGVGRYFSFIVPYLQENMSLMLAIGLLYGVMRVMGAIRLWKNKNVGIRPLHYQLRDNHDADDLYASGGNYGWNFRMHRTAFDLDTILRG